MLTDLTVQPRLNANSKGLACCGMVLSYGYGSVSYCPFCCHGAGFARESRTGEKQINAAEPEREAGRSGAESARIHIP